MNPGVVSHESMGCRSQIAVFCGLSVHGYLSNELGVPGSKTGLEFLAVVDDPQQTEHGNFKHQISEAKLASLRRNLVTTCSKLSLSP